MTVERLPGESFADFHNRVLSEHVKVEAERRAELEERALMEHLLKCCPFVEIHRTVVPPGAPIPEERFAIVHRDVRFRRLRTWLWQAVVLRKFAAEGR